MVGGGGGDPFQTPGGDPWAAFAGPKGKGRANAERRPEARPPMPKGNRGGSKGGGRAGGNNGLREDQKQRVEAWIEENMAAILRGGGCPTSEALLEGAMAQFPEAQRQSLELAQLVPLTMLRRKEQALWQFLLSLRSLCSVWSVRDAERAFVASSFVKKAYDVAEWGSLRLGPSLSSHPLWGEVFPEFRVPQYKWATHRIDPQHLMDGVTALELLFQHRVDSSGLNGGIDFEKVIQLKDFEQWLYSKEILLEDCGVCINENKFGLIMGSMNGALAQQHRLQQQAEKQYLEKLLEVAEQEVDTIARHGADGEDEAAFLDFQSRWRRVARSKSAVQLAFELCLWAKHKLGCEAAPLKPMAMTLAVELKAAEGEPRSHAADAAGKTGGSGLCISPVELEDKVRRQLQADGKALGLAGLARLERQSLGVGASMEDLLPGEGTFLNFLVSKPQLREMVENHMEVQKEKVAGLGREVAEVNVADMLRKADEALLELRPKSSVLDVQMTAHVEQKLRAAGLMSSFTELLLTARKGAGTRSNFGSGWALAVQDVKAYDLLQSHANFVLRSCGADVVQHHFGVGSAACALGLPPAPGSATPPQQSALETGLHFEAVVLAQLRKAQRPEEAKPWQPESLASSEAAAASKAAEAMVAFKRSSDFFQDLEDSYGGHVGGRQATTQQALDALASVDFLEDVESSTSWQALYGPSLGALEDFLCQAGREQLQKHDLRFLILAPGSLPCVSLAPRLMRLPTAVSVEALEMAVAGGQAKTAAAQLTSLCIDEPQNAEVLVYYFRQGLKALKERFESHEHSVAAVASSLVVAVLHFLPQGMRPHVGQLVVLPCLKEEMNWPEESRLAARRMGCSSMLPLLGQLWDVRAWNDSVPCQSQSGELQFLSALGLSGNAAVSRPAYSMAGPEDTSRGPGEAKEEEAKIERSEAPMQTTALSPATWLKDDQYSILRKIREEFCLEQTTAAQLQRNLGGALKRLGEDLYREQHHFVFELLQNGDDNKYPEGKVPCYKLILCENMLVALSNELGFEQANVESLCSVDSSTKPQLSDGAERIGKKGIGFKSVFKITDTPIIHSAGWHFRFNARLKLDRVNIKELGYIVPEVVPEGDMMFPEWTTEIRLPFKPELGNEEKAVLEQDFQALDGTLLLNLNKLRSLVLQQCNSSQLSRDDRPDAASLPMLSRCLRSTDLCAVQRYEDVCWRLVQISDGQVRNWLCVEGAFPFAGKNSRMVKLKISFPLPVASNTSEWIKEELTPQQTFCYLPLRSFGWRLVLHANFDVTASRNELHSNSPWNRKIKELLPKMLCLCSRIIKEKLMPTGTSKAFETLTWLEGTRSVPYGFFLRFMPLNGELGGGGSDFFSRMEMRIWQQLREEKCVLSEDGSWMKPSHIFQAPEVMKEVIPSEVLSKFHDGLCYMHSDFGTGLSAETLRHLGVRTPCAAFDVLLTVLRGMVNDGGDLSVPFVRKVLGLAYHLMWSNYQEEVPQGVDPAQRLEKLKALKLLPLQLHSARAPPGLEIQHCAMADDGLFLPEAVRNFPEALLESLDLKIMSPELFEGEDGRLVRRLLDHDCLGLRVLSPEALVLDGVMPLLEKLEDSPGPELRTVSLCVAYLASVRMSDCADAWARKFKRTSTSFESALQTVLKLPVHQDGAVWLHSGPMGAILLPPEFHHLLAEDAANRGEMDKATAHEVLATAVGADDAGYAMVAPELLEAAHEMDLPCRQLTQFLAQCGVTMGCFPVHKRNESLTVGEITRNQTHLKETAEQMAQEIDSNILAQSVEVIDYESPALATMLNSGGDIKGIVASYVVQLRECMSATLTLKTSTSTCQSSIMAALMNSSWVPSSGGTRSKPCYARFLWAEMGALELRLKPQLQKFLEKHLALIGDAPCCQLSYSGLMKQLGAQQLSSKDVLQLLREWSETKFESTEGEMTYAYQSLSDLQDHRRCPEVDAAFKDQDEKLIFVPHEAKVTKKQQMHDNVYRGKWLAPSSCCIMEDRTVSKNLYLLSRLEGVRELEIHYGLVLKEPFKKFGIEEWPTEKHRLRSLELAAESRGHEAIRIAEILLEQIFQWAGPGQARRQNEALDPHYAQELRRCFAKYHALPTSHGWLAWRLPEMDEEGMDDPFYKEISIPDVRTERVVLNHRLRPLFPFFIQLGMPLASAGDTAVPANVPVPHATVEVGPEVAEVEIGTLEVEGVVEDSHAETALRRTMAYLQCWFHQVNPGLYHALDSRAARLSRFEICIAEELRLAGREVDVHLEPGRLHIRKRFRQTSALGPLMEALERLLRDEMTFGLMPQQASRPQSLGNDILIRLHESERPGLAAMTLLQNHQYDGPDPCTLPLTWWFGVAPLELEDVLPTVTSKASRWSRKAAGGGSGGGSGGGTAPMGSASGGHPYHPAAHDDADPWANWVGLAERAPLMREAVGLARRVGRPHEDLEAHAAELERGHRNQNGSAHGNGNQDDRAGWAQRRAEGVEDFLRGLEGRQLQAGEDRLIHNLRNYSAQLRAMAAAGMFPEGERTQTTAVPPSDSETTFPFEGGAHLQSQPTYPEEMDALPEDAPNELGVPTTGRLSPEEERLVAEWGEEWVFNTLRRQYADRGDVEVRWLNQQNEQFEFYDVLVLFSDGRQEFYEVKSTVTTEKHLLEVSEKQVIEASKLKDRFNIVRVFGAGGRSARILRVPNPSAQCNRKATTGVELLLKLPKPATD